jgi:xanthine dehydrogenase accessory factor
MTARLIILGRGTTAERIAELGAGLGYGEIRLLDDVPADLAAEDHLIIAEDEVGPGRELLARAAAGEVLPAYLGYAAPHREGWKALVGLAAQKLPKERIDAISAPAGVDVGAETPEEVAIAVAAELVAIRRGRRRPSAGMAIGAARRRPALEASPRRLIGGFRKARDEDPGDGGGEGRN